MEECYLVVYINNGRLLFTGLHKQGKIVIIYRGLLFTGLHKQGKNVILNRRMLFTGLHEQ